PGDINNDGKIDANDLTSYTNYTGLRRGDSDFDYVSMGDVNRNGLLDAYDISVVATRLNGGIEQHGAAIAGSIALVPDKRTYAAGDEVRVTVKGTAMSGLNALSFALPYDPSKYEFTGVEPIAVAGMENLTYDRLHTSGDKVLYPTFVNIGDQATIDGDSELFVLKFRAKTRGSFNLTPSGIILVDKQLDTLEF
ncbi:MAG: alpha-xylosidase, partial [Muribaculaceae bacterium]|nr:alpha-xylosidase [Muribaculaceae bacterium]